MTVGVTSPGLWSIRRDLAEILGRGIGPALPGFRHEAFLGWGGRPSGKRAAFLAKRFGRPLLLAEDGMLKGFDPRLREPSHSFVVDRSGLYFETGRPNDLATIVRNLVLTADQRAWSRRMMDLIRAERITKYNNWPQVGTRSAGVPIGRPYLLLVDQVPGDASIAGAGAGPQTFGRLLRAAADEAAGRALIVRAHPAAARSSLLLAEAARAGIPVVVSEPINPWHLVEDADAVFTISSQIGFEALLADRPVVSFGRSFYAGRGLTQDRYDGAVPEPTGLEALFFAIHARYAVYLDLHDRRRCTLETALEQAIAVRDQRLRLDRKVYTGGLSPWKRRATTPFLIGRQARPGHRLTPGGAAKAAGRSPLSQVAVWGARPAGPETDRMLCVEDGFIRSVGLGVDLTLPGSLTIDALRAHYDCRGPSDLEHLLATRPFAPELTARARRLRERIVAAGVTKYNVGGSFDAPDAPAGRMRILVPGQVEIDRSILFGSPAVRTNAALVAECRKLFPDAFIVFKPHPDVVRALRPGGEAPTCQDVTALDGTIHDWIVWADRIETMTSLAGFEALLRDRPVGVHGTPFYAGWGLTDDRLPAARRTRRLSLDELVAGALILYPFYVHPRSRLPCSVERLVEALASREGAPDAEGRGPVLQRFVNRLAVRWRDARRR